ncbi:DUF7522 family protein [Halorussus sp. AFM4]|uniref:DUF7522 family protein n=1 Tax=Halorussus sp. AFM4 TaxID=3421651 RepID=UPI003EC057F1
MDGDTHTQLLAYLRDHVDSSLRGITVYDADNYDVIYIREDLRAERVRSEVDQMVERLRQETRVREQQSFPFGGLNGTLRSFEDAMVMHFPDTQERGTVVTLEPEVGRDLNMFMHECEKRINR